MRTYKFFEFNLSGLIERVHELRLGSDDLAFGHAAGLGSQRPVEIWVGKELIATVPPARLAARTQA